MLNKVADDAQILSAKQIDIVTDFYNNLSEKSAIRAGRDSASRVHVDLDSNLPLDFYDRLRNSDFKKDLNACFSSLEFLIAWKWDDDFVVTKYESVIKRLNGQISECKFCRGSEKTILEESDNRMGQYISIRKLKKVLFNHLTQMLLLSLQLLCTNSLSIKMRCI